MVLPNIKMNPPQVYMCSPSWTPSLLPPHSIPLGRPSAPAPSIQYRASLVLPIYLYLYPIYPCSVDLLKTMIFISSSSIYQHHIPIWEISVQISFLNPINLTLVAYYTLSIGCPQTQYITNSSQPPLLGILLVSISGIALSFKTSGSRFHSLDSQLHQPCTLGSSPIARCTLSSCSITLVSGPTALSTDVVIFFLETQ